MPLGADDVQAARSQNLLVPLLPVVLECLERSGVRRIDRGALGLEATAQYDVRAPTRHIRRDRHGPWPAGLHNDLSFAFVILRIEHLMLDLALLEQSREKLGGLDRSRAHEHGLIALLTVDDVL